jgi:predicted chitinase
MITASQVRAIAKTLGAAPRADLVDAIVRGWPEAVSQAKVTTRKRAAAFIGQIMTETGGLQILSESGAYREATIMKIFGVGKHSAKVTAAEAKRIAALPVAKRGPVLFNRVYGVGNPTKAKEFKNTGPNDGWLYRGGGMMQCTGKSNYAAMAKRTGLPLVEHPVLGVGAGRAGEPHRRCDQRLRPGAPRQPGGEPPRYQWRDQRAEGVHPVLREGARRPEGL